MICCSPQRWDGEENGQLGGRVLGEEKMRDTAEDKQNKGFTILPGLDLVTLIWVRENNLSRSLSELIAVFLFHLALYVKHFF